jgi:GNAT superfamily N-acetyltransferase
MSVRPMRPSDRPAVLGMRLLLWPDDDGEDDAGENTLVWEQEGIVCGFIIYSLRPWADGCDSRPIPYIEGWFVRADLRRRGIGGALAAAVEDWARAGGFTELGSDAETVNRVSLSAHRRLGFEPTERLQLFRKDLNSKYDNEKVVIEPFHGSRSDLLALFAQADDSATEIDNYLELGEVFVARRGQRLIGHVQLMGTGVDWEIKSIAVVESQRGQGIGSALIRAALRQAFSAGAERVELAAAAADIDNLRFYQRLGFRMERIVRDAFSAARGYPPLEVDGIPVRDQVWLSITASE